MSNLAIVERYLRDYQLFTLKFYFIFEKQKCLQERCMGKWVY